MTDRSILLVAHTGRRDAVLSSRRVVQRLAGAGVDVRVLAGEAGELSCPEAHVVGPTAAADGVEVVLVLGGDGTLLRAAEYAYPAAAPLLGVNLGRVGFLAEAERADLDVTVDRILACDYSIEQRLTLDVTVRHNGGEATHQWALNDVSIEKVAREKMIDVIVEVDGRPLSRWGCDGVVVATPTGSTAYAFSAGGPVVWPEVEALLLVPISAHALFSRPLVAAPTSTFAIELAPGSAGAMLSCDGRRTVDVPPGARVEARRGQRPVLLARLHRAPFTDRLVAKFGLPVQGWRGQH